MAKCDCYHKRIERRYTYNQIAGQPQGHDVEVGVCYGTKEIERCDCSGDRAKCDFYPEVRKEAKKRKRKLVEVVRCEDCAVPHNKWVGCPNLNGLVPPPDFYCAKGERKGEGK